MRQIFLLFVFIFLAFISAAILSFPLYKLLHIFTDIHFHEIMSQLSSLCGLLFIFLYLRFNNILNKKTAGFNFALISFKREIFTGILSGMMIMLVLVAALMIMDIREFDPAFQFNLNTVFTLLFKAILSGVMVALIEETLYRGALLGGLSETTNVLTAVIISSGIYSSVHFIKFHRVEANSDINLLTGFDILSDSFNSFGNPAILDYFLALFVFGVLLALVRLNKGDIIQCMGIHAGVVFAIKIIKDLTDYVPGNNFEFLVNRNDHLLGYLAVIFLVIINVVYYQRFFSGKKLSSP